MYEFDVFVSYRSNDLDRPNVRQLVRLLQHYGLRIWFDEDELRPGVSWQHLMELGIRNSKSGAVLIGSDGMGPWQNEEVQALLQFAIRLGLPLIPVFLPGAPKNPELSAFLANRHWVNLRLGFTTEGISQLIWGVTGNKQKLAPMPVGQYTTNMTEYIKKRGHLIHKLKAKDSSGRWAYYFVLVEEELEAAFLQALESNSGIDLNDYGSVVASCYGEKPNTQVREFLKEKYGFII